MAAGASALGVMGGCGTSETGGASAKPDRAYRELGVQLYTLRSLFESDFRATLKTLADIGFKDLEFAGLYDHKASDVRAYMDELGLVSHSSHVQLADLKDNFDKVMETAHTLGQTNLIVPWIAPELRKPDSYRELADLFNRRGEAAKAAGFVLAYHNHDFEFDEVDGEVGYDILLSRTASELVKMEIDLFWAHKAGIDPHALFRKAPGRFVACHVKDRSEAGEMVPVGDGVIDFQGIFAHAELAGLKHFYVEHDNPIDPVKSITRSFAHLMG
jgi:sugar phosphate isomerase/epimerase